MNNLLGQKFGRLTVLKKEEERYITPSGDKLIQWECQCECGNIIKVPGKYLKKGNVKSCGCLKRELTIKRNKATANDLTGQRFGKLIALYPTDKRAPGNYVIWHCKCDCGNEYEVASTYLLRGHTQSCGCLHQEVSEQQIHNLVGQQFGKLTVLPYKPERVNNHTIWICQCECGNICKVTASALVRGQTQSCGCLTGSIGEEQISKILRENNIKFERQKTFENCIFKNTNALAKFDFYLPDYNCLIEYDGIQHYEPRRFGGCSIEQAKQKFEETKEHDEYKNNWCKENNITLIRIPYTKKNKITIDELLPKKE